MFTGMVTAIVEVITGRSFRFAHEEQLQEGLARALRDAGYEVEREVRLNRRDRVDLLVEGVGIEVKVAGKAESVRAQVGRYAQHDCIEALVLVTTQVRHRLPPVINGKPCRVVQLAAAGL